MFFSENFHACLMKLNINNFIFILLLCQLLRGVPIGVGQVYACDNTWTGIIISVAIFISSPINFLHAVIGSVSGILAGQLTIRHRPLSPSLWCPLKLCPFFTSLTPLRSHVSRKTEHYSVILAHPCSLQGATFLPSG